MKGTLGDSELLLEAVIASLDGKTVIRRKVTGTTAAPEKLGVLLAEEMLAAGGAEILSAIE